MKPKPQQKKDPSAVFVDLGCLTEQLVCLDPLFLVLLGHISVGKSASGNTLLQREAFVSKRSFRSVTTEISEQTGTVGGQEVTVVDTPGIMNNLQLVRRYCQKLMRSRKPHVFLFILKIDRFTQEQEEALRSAMGAVGEEGLSRGLLLFTGADTLGPMTLEQFIYEDPDSPLMKVVQKFGDRVHMFSNTPGGPEKNQQRNQEQVLQLMSKIQQMSHGARPETCRADQRISPQAGAEGPKTVRPETVPPAAPQLQGPENQQDPQREEEVRLVLLGLPGAGKSSSGNTILGAEVFDTRCDFDPVTAETQKRSAVVGRHRVTVVDTPGFSDKTLEPEQLFKQIMSSIEMAAPGPHAFVIVVRIGRISEADCLLFELVQKLFYKDALKVCMVLFTHGDLLRGRNIEDLIKNIPKVQELVSKCNGRYSVFSNKPLGGQVQRQEQVQRLLHVVYDMIKAGPYTSEMFTSSPCGSPSFGMSLRTGLKSLLRRSQRYKKLYKVKTHNFSFEEPQEGGHHGP